MNFYLHRWGKFFTELQSQLNGNSPKKVDYFSIEKAWGNKQNIFPVKNKGDLLKKVGKVIEIIKKSVPVMGPLILLPQKIFILWNRVATSITLSKFLFANSTIELFFSLQSNIPNPDIVNGKKKISLCFYFALLLLYGF